MLQAAQVVGYSLICYRLHNLCMLQSDMVGRMTVNYGDYCLLSLYIYTHTLNERDKNLALKNQLLLSDFLERSN